MSGIWKCDLGGGRTELFEDGILVTISPVTVFYWQVFKTDGQLVVFRNGEARTLEEAKTAAMKAFEEFKKGEKDDT